MRSAFQNFGRMGAASARGLASIISSMFANNEQGAWYDPQDYGTSGTNGVGTLYQDSAGTTPVTAVEQPVGLMLDKRKGLVLGSELVTFASLTGTAEWSYASNVWTLTSSTSNSQTLSFAGLTSGNWYRMTVTVTAINAGSLSFRHPNSSTVIPNSPTISAAGTYTIYFVASSTAVWLRNSAVGQTITVSAFSVREIAGNHAYQSTSAARPTLRARYNLLTYSEQFNNAAWVKITGGTGTAPVVTDAYNAVAAPDGTFTASRLQASISGTTSDDFSGLQRGTGPGVSSLTGTLWVKSNTGATQTAWFRAGGAGRAQSITTTWTQITDTGTLDYFSIGLRGSVTGAGTLDILLWHPDQRASNLATGLIPTYQRIAAATDYDTVGFPVYIQGNGSSQFMLTASIDFSATDKMTVWAGVRKLSDAAAGTVAELSVNSSTNAGAFRLRAPFGASPSYQFQSNGTSESAATITTGFASPITNVLTGLGDISGDLCQLRVDGTQVASSVSDQGTGNYGSAYPLYLLARAGSSLWFGGYFYGAIIRGAASNESQIMSGERYLNLRSKAY